MNNGVAFDQDIKPGAWAEALHREDGTSAGRPDAPGAPPEPADAQLAPAEPGAHRPDAADAAAHNHGAHADEAPAGAALWRQRAAEAEQRMASLADRLASAERAAEELRMTLERTIRSRRVDIELLRAGVRDLEAGRALVDDGEPDVAEAVRRAVATRPGLFAPRGALSRAASAADARSGHDARRRRIADAARESGDRRLVLRYLRARRSAQA